MYLVAPDAGFFGNKVVKSILHFWICWNEQQQIPHPKSDPGDYKKNIKTWKTAAWGPAIVSVLSCIKLGSMNMNSVPYGIKIELK